MDDDTNRSFPSAIGDTPSSSDEDDNNSSILENEKLIETEDRLKALKEEMNKMENEHQQTLKENVMELEEKLKKESYKSREYHHEIKRLRLQNEELLEQLNNLQKQIGVDLTPSLQYPPDIDNEYEYIEYPIITVSYSDNIINNNNTFSFNDTHNNISSSMLFNNYKRNNNQTQQPQQSFANLKDTYNEMMSSLSQTFNDNDESITSFLTSFDDLMKAKSNNDKLVKEYKDMSLFYTYVNSKQSVIPNVVKNDNNDDENDSEIKQKKNDLIFAIKQLKSLLTDPPVIKKRINNLVKKNQNMLIKLEQLSQSLSTILPPKKESQNEISELEYIHNCLLKLVEGKYNDKIDINSLDNVINEVIDQQNNNNNPPVELLEHLSKLESLQNEAKEEKIECERLYGKYVNNTLEEDNLNLEDQKNKLKDENNKLQLQTENPELEPIQKLQLEKEELLSSEELSKYPDLNNQLNNIMTNTKNHDELLDEINELKQNIKDYRRQIEDFENEKQKYLNTLNIKDPESAQSLLKDLENEIKNLKEIKEGGDPNKMIENMNKEIDNKNIEILKLKDEIEKLKELLQGINNIVNDLTTASNTHDELYAKRNELLSSLSDGKDGEQTAEDEINKIKQLIEEKNNIASILDSSLAERNKGKQQIDFLNRFFSLLDESTNILVYEETKLRDRMIDLNTTSSFIIDSINIDKYLNNENENNNENVFNRLKSEILRINIENKKLLCFINYELKYKEYQKLLEERDQLIQDKSKLELELASGSNSNDALIVSDETYLDRLKQSLEVLSTSDDERGKKLAEFYKTKYDILEERLKTAKEKVETLTAEMNNQTMDVTNLTQENEMLKKKCEKLSSKVEKLNNGLMKLMAAKTVNES